MLRLLQTATKLSRVDDMVRRFEQQAERLDGGKRLLRSHRSTHAVSTYLLQFGIVCAISRWPRLSIDAIRKWRRLWRGRRRRQHRSKIDAKWFANAARSPPQQALDRAPCDAVVLREANGDAYPAIERRVAAADLYSLFCEHGRNVIM